MSVAALHGPVILLNGGTFGMLLVKPSAQTS
jgi:hypothetical protein